MSTAVELAGFACWVLAAFVWQSVALQVVTGLAALGLALLFVGYSLDGVSIRPAVEWVTRRCARGKKSSDEAGPASL